MEKINKKIINIFLIIISIFFIIKIFTLSKEVFSNLINITIPIILSFFISYSLYPCTKYLTKKIPYNIATSIVLLIFFLLISLLIYSLIYFFSKEFYFIKDDIYLFLSKLTFLNDSIKENFLSIDKSITLINKSTSFITNLIITIVLSIYFLFNMENIKRILKKYPLLLQIDKELFSYYKGFYLIILIEIIEYTFIYLIIGHPYFMLLGLLAGLTSIIPFFGAIITNIIALITSFNISKSLFILTSITMIIIPLFNSYFIEPKIYNKTLKISLINIILSVFILGSIFGLIGVVLALPLFIVIKNTLIFLYNKRKPNHQYK